MALVLMIRMVVVVAAVEAMEAAQVMAPAKALAILMESAIYGSKIDPVHAGEACGLRSAEELQPKRSAV